MHFEPSFCAERASSLVCLIVNVSPFSSISGCLSNWTNNENDFSSPEQGRKMHLATKSGQGLMPWQGVDAVAGMSWCNTCIDMAKKYNAS